MESIFRLDNRVALVTGSTRGIGWATAQILASLGATVAVHGRQDLAAAETRAAELRDRFGVPAIALTGNSSVPSEIEPIYREIHRHFRRLDILVNNAGQMEGAPLGMIPVEQAARMLNVNTLGPLLHLQQAARLMMRGKSGAIVNLTSILGTNGAKGWAAYSTAKAGLLGLTRSAAKELAPHGIRVNAVAPGFITTDMTAALSGSAREITRASIGLGRLGSPEDVARAVAFLASDAASYITGQVLGVDGGMSI
jgi:3-oxoacyl-[acyl-carrier protein] reductase